MATINKIPKCPPLRFPDFNDDWKETTLGEILSIGSGRDYKDLSRGGIPVFGTGGYMTSVDQFLMNGESVFIGRKGTIDKPFYYNGKFWTVDTLFYTHSFVNSYPRFVLYLFSNINWLEYNEASGVPSLSKTTISKIPICLPQLAEQKKIADFLSLIDERIQSCSETLRELKNQKAALLNQLFSQKLRFPDFNDEWRVTTLGEILLEVSERNSKNINRVISSTINGLFDQKEYFNRDIASKDISNYKILKRNQLVLSPQNIWMGNINVNLSFDVGIVSPSYKIYSLDHDSIDFRFASYALKTPVMLQRYKDSSSQGASVVRRNLDIDSFYSVTLPLPTLSEQKKIADFLSLIDERIEVEEQLLQQYEKQKRYLLRQMFV